MIYFKIYIFLLIIVHYTTKSDCCRKCSCKNKEEKYDTKFINKENFTKNKWNNNINNNLSENIDLSNSIKIGNGGLNDIYKLKYKGTNVVFSKSKKNGKIYKRYDIDYIAKNTFYSVFFSNNQPRIYNEYFCEFIEGYTLDEQYSRRNILWSINEFNNNNKNKIEIDDRIKNKLIIQGIVFQTLDNLTKNQIYITEDIGEKKIIKDVVFIDLDVNLERHVPDYFILSETENLFNGGKYYTYSKIIHLDKNIQQELIKILNVNIEKFVNELNKNIEIAVDKNQKFIKYQSSDGNYTFNVIKTLNSPIIKIYSKRKQLNGSGYETKINIINDFKKFDTYSIKKEKHIEFSEIKYENDKVYVKYKNSDNFQEADEYIDIYAEINSFELSNGSFYSIKNGDKKILPNIYIHNDIIDNKNIEILNYKTAKKEIILIYLTYILQKIKLCISSGDFEFVKNDLLKLKDEYEKYIENFKM